MDSRIYHRRSELLKMTEQLEQFCAEFQLAITEAVKLCYMTRAKELQQETCASLEDLREHARAIKVAAVAAGDEDSANCSLALEYILSSVIEELSMWIALKDDRTGTAWDHLVDSQMALHSALLAHEIASTFESHQTRLAGIEKILFPPMMFMSTGMTAKRCECSICGNDYDKCGHILGRPYMGKLCHRIIHAANLEEISLVPNPANKHCRVYTISNDGVSRDVLTSRVVSAAVSAAG